MTDATVNQYAPPTAVVADVSLVSSPGAVKVKVFSAKGRIGRLRCVVYIAVAWLIFRVLRDVLLVGGALIGQAGLYGWPVAALWAPLLGFVILTGVRRCHDLNVSGWWAVTPLLPIALLIWTFAPGSAEANRFGPPPPPHPTGLKFVAWMLPVGYLLSVVTPVLILVAMRYSSP